MGVKYFRDVVIGGMSRQDIWSAGKNADIRFVDGDFGGTLATQGNSGTSPRQAVTTVTKAIDSISTRGAVIYVRPRSTVASAQTYYQEDIVIPLTKPNMHIVGAVPEGCTGAQSGPQFKPLTVTGHLIDVKAANTTIENLRLTLTGGTVDVEKCIIHAVTNTAATQKPSGLVVRSCRFENDKSNPSYSGTEAVGCIGLGSVRDVIIEKNVFYNTRGGISYQSTSGVGHMIEIKNNIFSAPPATSDCFILINTSSESGIMIIGNYFGDGLPALSTGSYKRFVEIIGAGTGLLAGNFFASATNAIADATGSECIIPTTFFAAGNFYQGAGTTAPYGVVTTT